MEKFSVRERRIRDARAQPVWMYFNNDHDGYAITNATMLSEILK